VTSRTWLGSSLLVLLVWGCNGSVDQPIDSPSELTEAKTAPKKADTAKDPVKTAKVEPESGLTTFETRAYCENQLSRLPNAMKKAEIQRLCSEVELKESCVSKNGKPIFHFDRISKRKKPQRILVKSLIHGDELASGTVAASWMARLQSLSPRNTWRVIPISNPDGWEQKTRQNANGVDLNRNFPSKDWEELALKWWKTKKRKDPRRYPGPSAASESETKCYIAHIEEFDPDFIISIHTPLGLLDFDGPKIPAPKFKPLPWQSLGTYPGSLGRYMWKDKNVPVLTIELRGSNGVNSLESFDHLQDISGTVAIQAGRLLNSSANRN